VVIANLKNLLVVCVFPIINQHVALLLAGAVEILELLLRDLDILYLIGILISISLFLLVLVYIRHDLHILYFITLMWLLVFLLDLRLLELLVGI
jgi:hypothetical protein